MYVGVTAHKVSSKDTEEHRGGLIALWWSAPNAPHISAVAEAVFFDICELAEKIPDCALGRVMSSTPAASASGGQAASSSGPPPTSAKPPRAMMGPASGGAFCSSALLHVTAPF